MNGLPLPEEAAKLVSEAGRAWVRAVDMHVTAIYSDRGEGWRERERALAEQRRAAQLAFLRLLHHGTERQDPAEDPMEEARRHAG